MDSNIHNIAAWNAYKATLREPPSLPTPKAGPHIPEWAKWFDPDPVYVPKVIRFLVAVCCNQDVLYDKISRTNKIYT